MSSVRTHLSSDLGIVMTWKLARWAIALIAINIGAHAARGQAALPIDTLTEHVGTGVSGVIAKIQKQPSQQQSESVGQLVIALGTLSGLENALSDLIDAVAADPAKGFHGGTNGMVMDALNTKLNEIKHQFETINYHIDNVDPNWAINNAVLQIDIGKFCP